MCVCVCVCLFVRTRKIALLCLVGVLKPELLELRDLLRPKNTPNVRLFILRNDPLRANIWSHLGFAG